jgi:hypothetical protein
MNKASRINSAQSIFKNSAPQPIARKMQSAM